MAQQRSNRGFASMDPEAQRAIARKGGRAAHESGHAHEWTPEEAAKAGHSGGLAAHHRGRGAAHRETAARRNKPAGTQDASPQTETKPNKEDISEATEHEETTAESAQQEDDQENDSEVESPRASRSRGSRDADRNSGG